MIVEDPNSLWLLGGVPPALKIHFWVKPPSSTFYIYIHDKSNSYINVIQCTEKFAKADIGDIDESRENST